MCVALACWAIWYVSGWSLVVCLALAIPAGVVLLLVAIGMAEHG